MPEHKTTPASVATSARPRSLPSILKAAEVASLLRINRKTLYEAVQRGEVPGVFRIGRSLRFRRDAVLMWLSNDRAVLNSERNQG